MKPLLTTTVAAVFFCCLAFLLAAKPAMAQVTSETISCPAGKAVPIGNGFGCITPLPVGPPGHGAGPNDWGMCGILSLSGEFGNYTIARIIVLPSGFYGLEQVNNTASDVPTVGETCVHFTDFSGAVPPASDASAFVPPPRNGAPINIVGSAGNACIWAGESGNLETPVGNFDGYEGEAFAQYHGPLTNIGAQYATSYAFCSGYTTVPTWTGWKYFHSGGGFYEPNHVTSLGLNKAQEWCYMDGIVVRLLYPNYSFGPISAGLSISGSGDYSLETATPIGGVALGFNCLPLTQ